MATLHRFFSLSLLVITISLLSACTPPSGTWRSGTQTPQGQGGMGVGIEDSTMMPGTPAAVKVGLLLPLSGPQSAIGKSMEQAAQMALFDMGYSNFELIPRDTAGTPEGARQAAQDVITQDVKIILGPLLSSSVRAVKPLTATANIPMITFSTDWTLAGNNTYVMGFLPFTQIARVTSYAAQRGVKTAVIVAPNDQYGNAAVQAFETEATKNQIRITGRVRFNSNDPGLQGKLENLAKSAQGAQAVFIPVGGSKADEISSTLAFYGMTPDNTMRLGTGLWDEENLFTRAPMQGGLFAAPSPRQNAVFARQYQSVYGAQPPRIASLAYDATALAAVLAKQGGANPYSASALTNPNGFAGMDGVFRFKADGRVERGLAVMEIRNRTTREVSPAPVSFMQQ